MRAISVRSWLASVLVMLLAVATSGPVTAQAPDDLVALNAQVEKLYGEGKYAEATDIAQRSLALAEWKFGPDHPSVGTSLEYLAELHETQGRDAEAEPLYKRSLAIFEKGLGPDHPADVGRSLDNLAALYVKQGRIAEAEPLLKRALEIRERALPADHADIARSLNNFADLYVAQGRLRESESLLKRALVLTEQKFGPDHRKVGASLTALAMVYHRQGRWPEAEPHFRRALELSEKALAEGHPIIAQGLNNLAALYADQGRYADAEPLHKRALAIWERSPPAGYHPDIALGLNNLADVYRAQGRYAEAEPLLKRALEMREKVLPAGHPEIARSLANLASLHGEQDRYVEAEPLYKRALGIREKALPGGHPDIAHSLNGLGFAYHSQGRIADAVPLYKQALDIREKGLPAGHPDIIESLNNLAIVYGVQGQIEEAVLLLKRALEMRETALPGGHPEIATGLGNLAYHYQALGRVGEAELLYKRALGIRETALGPDHPDVGSTLNDLAALYLVQRHWARAADHLRRSTDVIVRRAKRGMGGGGETLSGKRRSEAAQLRGRFIGLVKAAHRLALAEPGAARELSSEMFRTAQWASATEAAQSLAQMAARGRKSNAGLSDLVRERQDLVAEWQMRDGVRTVAVSQAPDRRDQAAEAANTARMAAIDTAVAAIDKRLGSEFPDYAALASPEPLSVELVQADLRPDEVLVLFLDTPEWKPTPEETFIWVVTKTDMRWVRSELGTRALTREVATLRCGLDFVGAWVVPNSKCKESTGVDYSVDDNRSGRPLPFDANRAHALYKALFGQVESLIKGKHLLIVPSGSLTQLPLHALVTTKPEPVAASDVRKIAWLARSNPITVLPAVSSLQALRQNAKTSRATQPFLGVGNPVLDGAGVSQAKARQAALVNQSCSTVIKTQVVELRGEGLRPLVRFGAVADVAALRQASPLPETAEELCDVARAIGARDADVLLGARASESSLKRMSETGALLGYGIIHFATHGALAGEISGIAEPGLILTPPTAGSDADDGYLSASEIAALKLDADWVILSACNTAAGGAEGAEALSGLARAFFYAGARSLLVSHWYVDSEATVTLIRGAFAEMKASSSIGRAEAMRRSMLEMIDEGAHPSLWAPFVVVGEGAPQPQR